MTWWNALKDYWNWSQTEGREQYLEMKELQKNSALSWNGLSRGAKQLWNDWTGNTAINNQLAAQSQENQATREHNFKLAQYQNQANVAQWARENAYNSPSAQKARLQSAGLNADMMYGNGGISNVSASSPAMTGGSPGTPMDWSSLANKKSIGQAVLDGLQIRNAVADVEKKEAEVKNLNSVTEGNTKNNAWIDLEKQLGIDLGRSTIGLQDTQARKLLSDIQHVQALTANVEKDTALKALEETFKRETWDHAVAKLAAEANVSKADAKVALESVMYRIALHQYASEKAQFERNTAESEAAIAKFKENTKWFDMAMSIWDRGIRTFESVLSWKNFLVSGKDGSPEGALTDIFGGNSSRSN